MDKKYENILLALFFINWLITVILGYIGIFKILPDSNFLAQILGFAFWIINGYMHLRAYSAVIEDFNNRQNKKQP